MKKSSIFILVLSVLVVMFLSAFVGLSVGCDYAKTTIPPTAGLQVSVWNIPNTSMVAARRIASIATA